MTLTVTHKGFWNASPYSDKAKKAKLAGVDVQTLFTDYTHKLSCKCGYAGQVEIHEQEGSWGWGECPQCHRPFLTYFVRRR